MHENQLTIVLPGGARRGSEWLREAVPNATIVHPIEGASRDMRNVLADADAVVCSELNADDLSAASRLRLIHVLGAGYDGIALDALPPGCSLCNVHRHETAISEWILMVMLALTRRLLVYDRDLRSGIWHDAVSFGGDPELDLRERTAGLVGLGAIGARTARLLTAIGMRVIAVTRSPSEHRREAHGLDWLGSLDELPQLLSEADFAVLCVPLSEATRGLIGPEELRRLGPEGYLINVGRGPVVDEQALYRALAAKEIAGAGIDVWYRYPSTATERILPSDYPYWTLDNVVMTPHSSGWSWSTLEGRWRFISEQMQRLAIGAPLENVVAVG